MIQIIGACPKCHKENTIAIESDDVLEADAKRVGGRKVHVDCDHCGASNRLHTYQRERKRQLEADVKQREWEEQQAEERKSRERDAEALMRKASGEEPTEEQKRRRKKWIAISSAVMGGSSIVALFFAAYGTYAIFNDPGATVMMEMEVIMFFILAAILFAGRTINEAIRNMQT